MRNAFTLIELMIVIAIIAIIAAIAIPNLLESRITANEAAASASLKSGMFPGQVQYQSGSYVDVDGDGRGIYSPSVAYLAGAVGTAATLADAPTKSLSLMDASFNNVTGVVRATVGAYVQPTSLAGANKGAYDYYCFISAAGITTAPVVTAEDCAESYWCGIACPSNISGSNARRAFAVAANGSLYQSKGAVAQAATTIDLLCGVAAASLTAPRILGELQTTAAGVTTVANQLPVCGQGTTTVASSIYQK